MNGLTQAQVSVTMATTARERRARLARLSGHDRSSELDIVPQYKFRRRSALRAWSSPYLEELTVCSQDEDKPEILEPPPPIPAEEDELPATVSVGKIMRTVATYFNVRTIDMCSARRTANIVRPRQIVMYLAKTLTLRSLPAIGQRIGGKDHTTVLHGIRRIEALQPTDPQLAADIAAITELITNQPSGGRQG